VRLRLTVLGDQERSRRYRGRIGKLHDSFYGLGQFDCPRWRPCAGRRWGAGMNMLLSADARTRGPVDLRTVGRDAPALLRRLTLLPLGVSRPEAFAAGPVTRGDRRRFVCEEDAVIDIVASGDVP
jgi:hypothetical protein